MTMTQPAVTKRYTPEEYLALEDEALDKSEFYAGEIFAMASGTISHDRIAVNFITFLHLAFKKKPCEVFTLEVKILVKQNGLYTYPDASVVTGHSTSKRIGQDGNSVVRQVRFTRVYAKTHGDRWQVVAAQSTPVTKQ